MTDQLVFLTAISQAALLPIFYGVGSIFVSYIAHVND
jgi:hypothetical protein